MIGAGPIGVMTAVALRARGVERIVVVEKNEKRRERMRNLGFEAVGLDAVHEAVVMALGAAPSVVLECAGNPAAPNLAVELVGTSGRIVLLGVLEEPVEINELLLLLKEASMHASFAYRPAEFDEAIELIAAGKRAGGAAHHRPRAARASRGDVRGAVEPGHRAHKGAAEAGQ